MAKPDITLLGATYSGVSGVTLPKSGGGTATFPWVEGSETKTQNGTYDVTALAQLIVNVAGGGGSGLEYETGTYEPASDNARPSISFQNTHTNPPMFLMMSDATGTAHTTTYSNTGFFWIDLWRYTGHGTPNDTSSGFYRCMVLYTYRGNSTSTMSMGNNRMTSNSDDTGDSSTDKPRYWVSPTGFYPSSNSTSRYWRSGRTFKWIAVWAPTS